MNRHLRKQHMVSTALSCPGNLHQPEQAFQTDRLPYSRIYLPGYSHHWIRVVELPPRTRRSFGSQVDLFLTPLILTRGLGTSTASHRPILARPFPFGRRTVHVAEKETCDTAVLLARKRDLECRNAFHVHDAIPVLDHDSERSFIRLVREATGDNR